MGKVVNVAESERKYKLNHFHKDSVWDREFIIYQWYDSVEKEKKTKLIIDLQSQTLKWVRVTKKRLSNSESQKKVEYLSEKDISTNELIGQQFVCKRRSLKGKISVDYFVRSNEICRYLIEDEGDNVIDSLFKEENISIEDVTDDARYRNTNMTTIFSEEDRDNLRFLMSILFYPCQLSNTIDNELIKSNGGG